MTNRNSPLSNGSRWTESSSCSAGKRRTNSSRSVMSTSEETLVRFLIFVSLLTGLLRSYSTGFWVYATKVKEPAIINNLVEYYFIHGNHSSSPSSVSSSSSSSHGLCLLNDTSKKTVIDLICSIPEDLCLVKR